MSFLQNLNKSQQLAVSSYDSPLLILAGAGTGKTTTITARIANLILNHIVEPEYVLAVTFTNKAANEMKTRIEKIVGSNASKIWVGTFHGISARILRMYSKALDLEPNFLIIDESDRKRLIQKIIKDLNIDDKRFPYKVISFIISQLKEKCIGPEDEERISNFKYRDLDILTLYKSYQYRLRTMNAVDFDDLIFENVRLFKKEPRILQDLQSRFQYITVDEYQDTNELQHLWLRLLAGGNPNVCCVGDEDQSIYGWRGACVDYILGFEKDFPGAKIIRLEDNYRSTQEILDSAMSVISNNKQRYNKTLKSNLSTGIKPYLFRMENDRDEKLEIIQQIIKLQETGNKYSDIALLVRATHQMRGIEDSFIKHKIPYKIIGGIKFYDRKEIKDLVAYIRFIYSLTDEISLERIINYPKRGIGEKSFNDIMDYIKNNNWNLIEGLNNIANFGNILSSKASIELRKFVEVVNTLHRQSLENELNMSDFVDKIYHLTGYALALQEELPTDPEIANKIENINEFISSVAEFNSIDQFLEHISLMSANDDDNATDAVNIMTMHAAKGLEFKYVFLPCWDEGSFPSQKAIEDNGNEGLEEERRLAYVALTRARNNFYVFTCKQRMLFGKLALCNQSKFIGEMKNTLTEIDKTYKKSVNLDPLTKKRYIGNNYDKQDEDIDDEKSYSGKRNIGFHKNEFYNTNVYAEEESKKKNKVFSIGDKVHHSKFGNGIVKGVFGKFYEVKFEDGTKRILNDIDKVD